MSVQFGTWNMDGKPVDQEYLEKVNTVLARYAPDGGSSHNEIGLRILYRSFHTTKESRHESQPLVIPSGAVLAWDGRLDNRSDLARQLRNPSNSTDVSIVAAAYETWGTACFAKLTGDWALSIWDPRSRSLILAKDPIGIRHLYYSIDNDRVGWSTVLDPLLLFSGKTFALCREYVAAWLSSFPASHLTPYVGIHSVPPSSSVVLRNGRQTIDKYWDIDPDGNIFYKNDSEYEEHFRAIFAQAVHRRVRSDRPILAELSGGLDSSSIVCMADSIARESEEVPRIDTISFYDDSEPNWDERPYFMKVEEKRGRRGCHIDVATRASFSFAPDLDHFAATPAALVRQDKTADQFSGCLTSQGSRVVLSGIGGDEVTGGSPTPAPELQDLLARAKFTQLARQLRLWAVNKRKPLFHLFVDAARGFLPSPWIGSAESSRAVPWLDPHFETRRHPILQCFGDRLKLFGPLPSFQENLRTLEVLRRQIECAALPSEPTYEKRYPYLDRDLLTFLFHVPRNQLVRPGERRSLTRRALQGIVPREVLDRKRKAYVARGPLVAVSNEWEFVAEIGKHMRSDLLGIVRQREFAKYLERARTGQECPTVALMRTIAVERWLRHLEHWNLLSGPTCIGSRTAAVPKGQSSVSTSEVRT